MILKILFILLFQRADFGITDLTITAARQKAVDFTSPFMNLGITILYKKPTKQPPNLFSFISPFSYQVINTYVQMLLKYKLIIKYIADYSENSYKRHSILFFYSIYKILL